MHKVILAFVLLTATMAHANLTEKYQEELKTYSAGGLAYEFSKQAESAIEKCGFKAASQIYKSQQANESWATAKKKIEKIETSKACEVSGEDFMSVLAELARRGSDLASGLFDKYLPGETTGPAFIGESPKEVTRLAPLSDADLEKAAALAAAQAADAAANDSSDKALLFGHELLSPEKIDGKYLQLVPWRDGTIELRWSDVSPKDKATTIDNYAHMGCLSRPKINPPPANYADAATSVILTSRYSLFLPGGLPEMGAPSGYRLMIKDRDGKVTFGGYLITGREIGQIDNGFNMKQETKACQ